MNIKLKKRMMMTIAVAIATPFLVNKVGLDDEMAKELIRVVMVYILGQSATDAFLISKGKKED